ncbi:hypothetical protein H4W00_000243 [Psychrobacter sp. PL19]|uniref:hypothetical protein n=1 Tax=Psychrobacter sp. PL19 TaxID=2760711 RepID=UPI001AE3992B
MSISIENLDCWDVTWFASDKEGKLGVFFSNGTTSVLVNNILKEQNYENCYEYFNHLEDNGSIANFCIENQDISANNTNFEEFIFYAKKGLHVYDTDDLTQPSYILIAKPSIPLLISDIDNQISKIIENYEGVFSDILRIEPVKI